MSNNQDPKYIYWCDDCGSFVRENHRCQQWNTVTFIRTEAYHAIKAGKNPILPAKEDV